MTKHVEFSPFTFGSAIILWFFLVVPLPCAILFGLHHRKWAFIELLPFVVMCYAALRIATFHAQGTPRLVTICFWIFVYVFLGLVPLIQFLNGEGFPLEGQTYGWQQVVKGYSVVVIGLLAFDIGQWFSKRRSWVGRVVESPVFSRVLTRPRLYLFSIAAISASVLMIVAIGGIEILLVARNDRVKMMEQLVGGEGQALIQTWGALLRTPSVAAFLCLLIFWSHGRRLGLLGKILLFACGGLALLISNPISAPRFWVGTVLLAAGFIVAPWRRAHSVLVLSVGIILILTVVFPFADAYRYSTQVTTADKMHSTSIADVLATKPDFDAQQQIFNAVGYVRAEGLTYGSQLAGSLLFWVPRGKWLGKPEPTGVVLAEQERYTFKNLSAPLWAELYIDGGGPFVFAGFLLYGVFVARLERRYILGRDAQVPSLATIFVPIFAPYQFFLLRGSLMPALACLAPTFLWLYASTSRGHQTGSRCLG